MATQNSQLTNHVPTKTLKSFLYSLQRIQAQNSYNSWSLQSGGGYAILAIIYHIGIADIFVLSVKCCMLRARRLLDGQESNVFIINTTRVPCVPSLDILSGMYMYLGRQVPPNILYRYSHSTSAHAPFPKTIIYRYYNLFKPRQRCVLYNRTASDTSKSII